MKRNLWIFVGLALLATLVGVVLSRESALRYDERWTLYNAGGLPYEPLSLSGVWQRIADDDPWQSPGYFLVLNLWGGAVGWSVYAARIFSLLMGLLALAWMYRLGLTLANRRVALYATVALLGSAFFTYYLQEMRPYTLYVLFTCMTVWAYWRVTVQQGGYGAFAVLFAALIGLAYTHPIALLTALVVGLYHVLFTRIAWRRWFGTLGVMLAAALIFLPWLLILLRAVEIARADTTRHAVSLSSSEIITQVFYAFSSGSVALFALLVVFGLRKHAALRLILLWIVAGIGAVLLTNQWLPVFVHIRYLTVLWPALALLMALGIDALRERGINPAIPLLIWLAAGLIATASPDFFASLKNSERTLPAAAIERATGEINTYGQAGDVALFHTRPPGWEWQNLGVLDVYLWGSPVRFTDIETLHPNSEAPERDYITSVQENLADADAIWTAIMPDVPHTSRQRAFFEAISADFGACDYPHEENGIRTQYFARLTPLDDGTPVVFTTPDGETLGVEMLRRAESAAKVRLAVGSTGEAGIPYGRYAAFVHLLDANGAVVAQGDVSVGDAPRLCSLSVIPLDGVAVGTYTLAFGVYDRTTLARLDGSDGAVEADRFDLFEIRIGS